MKNTNRLIMTIVGVLILASSAHVFAQDWPQWRGAHRDGKVTGFNMPESWPRELTSKWKITVGAGDATPALVGGKLYVCTRQGSDEVTMCLDAGNGKELWQDRYAAQAVTGAAARHPGPRSSPVVVDGKVVTLGVGGILSCLDAATGKVIWRKDEFSGVVPQFFTGMSPIIVDGIVIAHLGGKDNGAIIAFDLITGNRKWKWTGDGPAYASPVLMTVDGTRQIVVQTEKKILSVAMADGKLLWQVPTPVQRRFYNSVTPLIDGQTVIYTGQGQGTRAMKVQKQGDDFVVKELWNNEEIGTAYNTPVLKDSLLFGLSDRGKLFCMNAMTGQTAWTDSTNHKNFGSLLDAGSVILALSSKSELIAFNPSDKEYTEIAIIKVADTPTYAHPVIAGKRIYVKDEETLAMWMIE